MPVPDQRDPEIARTTLQRWLQHQLPGATGVAVTAQAEETGTTVTGSGLFGYRPFGPHAPTGLT